MPTIVLCYPVNSGQIEAIEQAAPGFRLIASDQERIRHDIFAADIFCGHARGGLPWAEVVRHGKLQWIQSSAAGLDHCLSPEVVNSGVIVSGASGLFANQVAEQTLALLLGLLRRIPEFHSAQLRRHHERRPTDDLHGKRVGIHGLGGNGLRIAELLAGFNVELLGCDRFPEALSGQVSFPVLTHDQSLELFRRSQIVIAALPLTEETRGLIAADHFRALPPGSYFVNVGRGQTVNEAALGAALSAGHLAGAGLDVVAVEPLPEGSPVWDWPNLLLTPHVGAQASQRYQQVTDFFVENLRRWRTGESLLNLVDKQLGFPRPEHRWLGRR
jgi:phosphoglycerate dehydrogenase-like enzyme